MKTLSISSWLPLVILGLPVQNGNAQDVARRILDVPDYAWHAGCFGTATGNLMGYWDRHGFGSFYTGPTGGGLAPLNSFGGNIGIQSLWVSEAGVDGRPANSPGHMDDYWVGYETTNPDPYATLGRTEHQPDCTGDFIGLNQKKWQNLAGECDGNIDGYSFVFWDPAGDRRVNYRHTNNSQYIPDIQSGLRAWTQSKGADAEVFTQLADFNPRVPAGKGFRFTDLKREIDQGYPVLVFLQDPNTLSRNMPGMAKANPPIHGMLIYGYGDYPSLGFQGVYYKTSWGQGEGSHVWAANAWEAFLPVRGFIGYRPKPQITSVTRKGSALTFTWRGPASRIEEEGSGTLIVAHRYQLVRASSLGAVTWQPVGEVTTNTVATITESDDAPVFYRLRLLHPGETL